ncbi:MAG: indolepyruvate ferredoxin oxidoreductase subunit alpha [Deltaproteobacteria bacterium]|nr:indolepyruvate ferredoxin oxidoreductase subunit alpha [Deltaproteobacteria bacterium]
MKEISNRDGGATLLLQGNQAIARGALEAGVLFCAGYPGNPSSEIIETLAAASSDLPIYVEWSTNEKVALEAATAASFAGCKAIASMKQNGVNVVSDFLTNLTLSGTKGGIVLVSCDDPGGISSTNEEDARIFAQISDIPLLEPSTPQEALDMTKWAFELSEEIRNIVMIRSVSRLSHTRSTVQTGEIPETDERPHYEVNGPPFNTFPILLKHRKRHEKLARAIKRFETSPFNRYDGPDTAQLLIIASGCAWNYAAEAVEILDLRDRVGILKLGTTWPLPQKLLHDSLARFETILFVEEVEPFVESNVMAFAASVGKQIGIKTWLGKTSGHIPDSGELSPGLLAKVLADIFDLEPMSTSRAFLDHLRPQVEGKIPPREFGFCPGCPHRASYYAMKTALAWDNREGFVSGDIGCYSMGMWPTGFNQVKSVHAMGSGVGLASGYGKLEKFGFHQPVLTVVGDSTFFHASIPALVNAQFNQSDMLLVILDNSATAMTGFQPHPGTGMTAMGDQTEIVNMEALCRSLGAEVRVEDPFDMERTARTIYELLQRKGLRTLILRRKCALVQGREGGFPYHMEVDQEKCVGESCGCGRYCTRIFRCPGLVFDEAKGKAKIDQVICVGCGVCAQICPQGAIQAQEI